MASYSTAAVNVTWATGQAAGLVGWNQRRAAVAASYATGTVTGPSGATLHGFANGPGAVESSYWNSATFPDDGDSTSREGRTAAQLQTPTSATSIYAGWNALDLNGDGEAESPWDFGTASDYPALAVGTNNAGGLVEMAEERLSGAQLYAAHCLTCHSLDSEERGVGPHLADLVGRRIGRLGGWMSRPRCSRLTARGRGSASRCSSPPHRSSRRGRRWVRKGYRRRRRTPSLPISPTAASRRSMERPPAPSSRTA